MKLFCKFLISFLVLLSSNAALADYPRPWQMMTQEAVTPIMSKMTEFHDILLVVIFAVSVFVFILLAYVFVKFNAKANPVPSKNSHNTLLEIVWTVVPVIILVAITIPSLRILYFSETIEDAEMTLKVTGNQWYWSYQYPDNGDISFDSYMIPDEEIGPGQFRLLEVDNRIVIPVDTTIRVQLTASDVIHNWAVPAFGVKLDAVPGRLNENWIRVKKIGTYYGQCSELCGVGHGFMPIAVEVVSKENFALWVEGAKKEFAEGGSQVKTYAAVGGN